MVYTILEFNLDEKIGVYTINISDKRLGHGRRIKLVGLGTNKGAGTSIPIPVKIRTFDELLSDNHVHISRDNDSGKYVKYTIGFIVLSHIQLSSYFDIVDNGSSQDIKNAQDALDEAYRNYSNNYRLNDIPRIRRDANAYAIQMRAQGY